jgi:porin
MKRLSLTGAILIGIASVGALWSSQVLAQDDEAAPAAPPTQAPVVSQRNPLQRLMDDGVLLRGTLNDDYQRNTTGGLEKGTENAGTATLGADFNMEKLFGITGGQFHILFSKSYGQTLQNEIGNYIKTQGWYYPYQKTQLAQFAWEQNLADGKVNILVGRTNTTALFARSNYGCSFISGSQCPYYLPLFTGGFSGFPYVTWGGRVRYNATRKFYIETGVYSVDPERHLEHGFNFSTRNTTGVVIPVEAGYETDFGNDPYPRHYKLGWWHNNAASVDPLLNSRGTSKALFPGAPLLHHDSRTGMYLLADQVVYRPDESHRNLALFGSYATPFDSHEIFASQGALGTLFTGPFKSRPLDTVGIMVTRIVFSNAQTLYMNQLLAKHGSTSFVKSHETMIEANYGFKLAPGVSLLPNITYIINPDTSQRPDATFAPKNTFVVGLRLAVNLGDMFGLPFALPGQH